MGTQFDLENGEFALTKEGAHSQRRILHANGDATGFEIVRRLSEKAVANPHIEVWDDHFVIDLITRGRRMLSVRSCRSRTVSVCLCAAKRRFFAQAAQDSCIGIRRTRRLPPAMASRWLIGPEQIFRMWSSFNSIRPRFVIRARRGF